MKQFVAWIRAAEEQGEGSQDAILPSGRSNEGINLKQVALNSAVLFPSLPHPALHSE
jgi:hypothetical protein